MIATFAIIVVIAIKSKVSFVVKLMLFIKGGSHVSTLIYLFSVFPTTVSIPCDQFIVILHFNDAIAMELGIFCLEQV